MENKHFELDHAGFKASSGDSINNVTLMCPRRILTFNNNINNIPLGSPLYTNSDLELRLQIAPSQNIDTLLKYIQADYLKGNKSHISPTP